MRLPAQRCPRSAPRRSPRQRRRPGARGRSGSSRAAIPGRTRWWFKPFKAGKNGGNGEVNSVDFSSDSSCFEWIYDESMNQLVNQNHDWTMKHGGKFGWNSWNQQKMGIDMLIDSWFIWLMQAPCGFEQIYQQGSIYFFPTRNGRCICRLWRLLINQLVTGGHHAVTI